MASAATPPNPRVAEIAALLRQQIAGGSLSPTSAVAIINTAASLGASWDIVEDVIAEIAKGADGISGTEDDIIPASTVSTLKTLLHGGVVRDMASWVVDLQRPTGGAKPWWLCC